MDSAQKAIAIGVGLLITISLISAVLIITNIGTDTMRSSNEQLSGVSASVSSQLLADYDYKTMTGASVIATIKKFYNKPNFLLIVKDVNRNYATLKVTNWGHSQIDNTVYKFDGTVEMNNNPSISSLSNEIVTNENYRSYIIYQKQSDAILGLYFKKE